MFGHLSTRLIVASYLMLIVVFSTASSLAAAATLSTNSSANSPASKIKVKGNGFAASEAIDVYFDSTNLLLTSANGAGAFKGSFIIPKSASPGTHWLTAVGRTSRYTAQSTVTIRTDWAQFRFSPWHKGYNPYENVLGSSTVGGLGLLWSIPAGSQTSPPAVVKGIVYSGSVDGKLYAIDAVSGEALWSVAVGSPIASPAVANGVVYVGAGKGLFAFDASTGAKRWSIATASSVDAPTLSNGVVYAGSDKLYAVNAATGEILWSVAAGGLSSSPAVEGSIAITLVRFDEFESLYAFDVSSGQLLWSAGVEGGTGALPALVNGVGYESSADSSLFAFKAATGEILWRTPGPSGSPAVVNGVVYAGGYGGELYAISTANGQILWETAAGYSFSAPTVANGVVYIGSDYLEGSTSTVSAFNAATGALLWSRFTGSNGSSSPVVVNGVVYAGASDGKLYAFGLSANRALSSPARPNVAMLTPNLALQPQH